MIRRKRDRDRVCVCVLQRTFWFDFVVRVFKLITQKRVRINILQKKLQQQQKQKRQTENNKTTEGEKKIIMRWKTVHEQIESWWKNKKNNEAKKKRIAMFVFVRRWCSHYHLNYLFLRVRAVYLRSCVSYRFLFTFSFGFHRSQSSIKKNFEKI